jgi:uncharacterized protein
MSIPVPDIGTVSGLWMRPAGARWALVLGHGAGAGMRQAFLEAIAGEFAERGVATLRYQFPYMEAKRRRVDTPPVAQATVAAAVRAAMELAGGLPVFAGGKSFGGRMTSQAAAEGLLVGVRGLVFFGFPLHPPGSPGVGRSEHLDRVQVPMLFLQGTRDDFADLSLLRPICERLGSRATLHVVDGADHSFHMLKSSGRTDAEVRRELIETILSWVEAIARG